MAHTCLFDGARFYYGFQLQLRQPHWVKLVNDDANSDWLDCP